MKYKNIEKGIFISRPNRFIAFVNINGKEEICHVKNTGRCKELLIPGASVFVENSDNPHRKTKYDLISVYKNGILINIDSQAPNKVFHKWAESGKYFKDIKLIKPEYKYKNSRFDFFIETKTEKILAEIKGVTLEEDGVVKFPDAPTKRGLKHIYELCESIKDGYSPYIFFIVQMENASFFTPNKKTHPEFADALKFAENKGVKIKCLDCTVLPDSLKINKFIKTVL